MFEEATLIARIQAQTGYPTTYVNDTVANTLATATSTKVYIGHSGIRLQDNQMMYADGYSELDNPEVIITRIQIICPRTDWVTARMAVRNAYKNWSPIDDGNFSNLFFIEGHILGLVEKNVMYEELIGLMYLL
jgi:hypothetical protein